MIAVVRSEWRKVRTTRTMFGLFLGMLAMVVIPVIAFTQTGEFPLDRPLDNPAFREMPRWNLLFALVLGIRAFTDEYRHGTMAPTLLMTPDRWKVLGAKLLVITGLGLLMGLVVEGAMVGLAAILATAKGVSVTVPQGDLVSILIGVAVAGALMAALGVGLGAAIRFQVAAIIGGIVWFFVIDDLLVSSLKGVAKFLPGQAMHALAQVPKEAMLIPWQGGVVLALYAIAIAGVGWVALERRDVG